MIFDRIASIIIALSSTAILAYGLTLATTAADYAILGATGAAALLVLGLLVHTDNH